MNMTRNGSVAAGSFIVTERAAQMYLVVNLIAGRAKALTKRRTV
jgi:hypothetical protein